MSDAIAITAVFAAMVGVLAIVAWVFVTLISVPLAIVAWVFVTLISVPLGQVLVAIAIFVAGFVVGQVAQLFKR